jgi:hypothetical protein
VKGCKQQSWKDLQARHQQIRNRLSADQVRIISPSEIAAILDMYRNFFAMLVWHPEWPTLPLISVPNHTVGAPSFAAHMSVLHTRLIAAAEGGFTNFQLHVRREYKIPAMPI